MEITAEEKVYLRQLLADALGTLREQVYHADTPAFKDHLKREKVILEGVLAKLAQAA